MTSLTWSRPIHGVRRAATNTHKFEIIPIVGMGDGTGRSGKNSGYDLVVYRRNFKRPVETRKFKRVQEAIDGANELAASLSAALTAKVV